MSTPELVVAWINALGALLWPTAIIVVALLFQKSIREWLSTAHSVSVGPFEFEREIEQIAETSRKLLADTSKLQLLLAESRAIEVEVFLSYPLLSDEQRDKMQGNLKKLKQEIEKLRKS